MNIGYADFTVNSSKPEVVNRHLDPTELRFRSRPSAEYFIVLRISFYRFIYHPLFGYIMVGPCMRPLARPYKHNVTVALESCRTCPT